MPDPTISRPRAWLVWLAFAALVMAVGLVELACGGDGLDDYEDPRGGAR